MKEVMKMNYNFALTVLFEFIIAGVIFAFMYFIARFILNKINEKSYFRSSKLFHPEEYFPEEEIFELKQIFYLFMIVLFVLNILYLVFFWNGSSFSLLVLDILLSLYLVINLEKNSAKDFLILFLLMPFVSLNVLIFNELTVPMDILHSIPFFYYIKVYYDKFMEYTATNSLGITIMLLFFIIFISFLFTILVEDVTPIDSLVMVSNAFTSNGYTILGTSNTGKLNEIFLVWSGFILSGVGTATLTLAIVKKHIDDEFDRLEKKVKKNKKN